MPPDFDAIRRALGRGTGAPAPPPVVHEPTARLVYSDLGLPELFAAAAHTAGMAAELVHVDDLATAVAAHLHRQGVTSVTLSSSPLLRKMRFADAMGAEGVLVTDAAPAIVTGCDAAVAETGSLVFRGPVPPGWAASAVRVVILEPKNFVPDLIDLFAAFSTDVMLVSGPQPTVRVYGLY